MLRSKHTSLHWTRDGGRARGRRGRGSGDQRNGDLAPRNTRTPVETVVSLSSGRQVTQLRCYRAMVSGSQGMNTDHGPRHDIYGPWSVVMASRHDIMWHLIGHSQEHPTPKKKDKEETDGSCQIDAIHPHPPRPLCGRRPDDPTTTRPSPVQGSMGRRCSPWRKSRPLRAESVKC